MGDESKPTSGDLFKSVWGILAIIVTIVSLTFGVISFLYKTFPTVVDLNDRSDSLKASIVPKPEYYKKINDIEDRLLSITEEFKKKNEYIRKDFAEDITKLRAEYRTEKLLDILMRIKVVDESLLKDPNNRTLQNYRQFLCKEYDRMQIKLDNSLKELEK
jgi:uncharacterized protein YaaR (DUF327 family)